jgi:hypothetical protein
MQRTALPTPEASVTRRRQKLTKLAEVLSSFGMRARYTAAFYRITAVNSLIIIIIIIIIYLLTAVGLSPGGSGCHM